MKKLFLLFLVFIVSTNYIGAWNIHFPYGISIKIPEYFEPTCKNGIFTLSTLEAFRLYNVQQDISLIDGLNFQSKENSNSKEEIDFNHWTDVEIKNADEFLTLIIDSIKHEIPIKIVTYSTKNTPLFTAARCIFIQYYSAYQTALFAFTLYANNEQACMIKHIVEIGYNNDTEKAMAQMNKFIDLNPEYLGF